VALAVLEKDLLTEWRSRDRVVAMAVFSMLMAMVFHFALPTFDRDALAEALAGLLWTAFVFSALLGLNRSFALELENDALANLMGAPGHRGQVFLGKTAANFVLVAITASMTTFAFAVLFDVSLWAHVAPLAAIVALGLLGLCAIGTLFACMSVRTRFRELLLPILLLPALFPVVAGAVEGTLAALAGDPLPYAAVQLLVVVDGVYLVIGFLGFDLILDE
jgi:heme exporter protein B